MSEEKQYTGNTDEQQYLDICQDIILNGQWSVTRGHKIKSIFGTQSRYDLRDNTFPLLTTKKVFTRGIIEELLWFMRGHTDSKLLEKKGVNIWKFNSTEEEVNKVNKKLDNIFENSLNNTKNGLMFGSDMFYLEKGNCGPIYGEQFRNYNYNISGNGMELTNNNIPLGDQVANVLYELKHNPFSRRHVINLWNPLQIPFGVLPPCHMVYQFDVSGNGNPDDPDDPAHQNPCYLSLSMYQRSADFPLGVPFNIASCALLTALFAKILGQEPRELIHTTGNSHLYANQIPTMKEQLKREPYPFPKLEVILPPVSQKKLDDGTFWNNEIPKDCNTKDRNYIKSLNELFRELSPDNFKITDYKSHPKLNFEFSV